MRSGFRRKLQEEEEESAFVSMTDMTVSFLFIVMILLAFFASQLHSNDMVPRPEYVKIRDERDRALIDLEKAKAQIAFLQVEIEKKVKTIKELEDKIKRLEEELKRLKDQPIETYLSQVADQRRRILVALQAKLKIDFPEFQEIFSIEADALRFKGDGLFSKGSSDILPDKKRIIESLATHLSSLLPCYSLGKLSAWKAECNEVGALIEAIQIEGHTDSTGSDEVNFPLSTNRANSTFFTMIKREPSLVEHRNAKFQTLLSVAGYGKMRPTNDNRTAKEQEANRRIDLRIIMYTPSSVQDIEKVKADLRRGALGEGAP